VTILITDTTDIQQFMQSNAGYGGCKHPDDYVGPVCASPTDDSDLIPYEEFPDRISDMEKNKTTLEHVWLDSPIGKPMQSYTNYCWAWCVVDAMMVFREVMGLPFVKLSPSSVAAPIMNFSNQGGWPEEALKWIMQNGVAPVTHVDYVTTSPRGFRNGWKEEALKFRIEKFESALIRGDSVAKNKQRIGSKLLSRKPLGSAFMFMSHAMAPLRLTDDNPRLPANNPLRYGLRVLNSHNDGIMKLEGQRAMPDSAFAIAQTNFAE